MFKKQNAKTPSQRHLLQINTTKLFIKKKPIKNKTIGLKKTGGRNNLGRITVRHHGGGHKKKYRLIEFKREPKSGIVQGLEYDPNRTSYIARILGTDTKEFYILAPQGLTAGMSIQADNNLKTNIQIGDATRLENLPIGSLIHNLAIKENKRGQYIRAAGTFGQLIQKTAKYARIKLPSSEQRYVPLNCFATLGSISNENHKHQIIGKAGRSRWLGIRPSVRGVAMNPVDHPHGGGEGKTSGGRPSVTPWGRLTKGQPTRKKNKKSLFLIQDRKKK